MNNRKRAADSQRTASMQGPRLSTLRFISSGIALLMATTANAAEGFSMVRGTSSTSISWKSTLLRGKSAHEFSLNVLNDKSPYIQTTLVYQLIQRPDQEIDYCRAWQTSDKKLLILLIQEKGRAPLNLPDGTLLFFKRADSGAFELTAPATMQRSRVIDGEELNETQPMKASDIVRLKMAMGETAGPKWGNEPGLMRITDADLSEAGQSSFVIYGILNGDGGFLTSVQVKADSPELVAFPGKMLIWGLKEERK